MFDFTLKDFTKCVDKHYPDFKKNDECDLSRITSIDIETAKGFVLSYMPQSIYNCCSSINYIEEIRKVITYRVLLLETYSPEYEEVNVDNMTVRLMSGKGLLSFQP